MYPEDRRWVKFPASNAVDWRRVGVVVGLKFELKLDAELELELRRGRRNGENVNENETEEVAMLNRNVTV